MPDQELSKLTLGEYIRAERQPSMSLRAFAKKLGVSASYLSDLELDRRKTNRPMIERIATTFRQTIGGSATERSVAMLRLSGLMTPEHECLLALWNHQESLSVAVTLDVFEVLFKLDQTTEAVARE